jgi:hypothetical protein
MSRRRLRRAEVCAAHFLGTDAEVNPNFWTGEACMNVFSERHGLKPIKSVIQIESMDEDLRNGIWNALSIYYWKDVKVSQYLYLSQSDPQMFRLLRAMWLNHFKAPVDILPTAWEPVYDILRKHFFSSSWNGVYDFIEFVPSNYPDEYGNSKFKAYCNCILEREVSAFRFVGNEIAQITAQQEIVEIEGAMQATDVMRPVTVHINAALELFADRKSPDYRNSIKESISAVEAACRILTGNNNATLGDALKQLKAKVALHSALEKAFSNMYGYTSDAEGIRHALMDEPTLESEDAKFMLVSCSAFVNYLRSKSARAGPNG